MKAILVFILLLCAGYGQAQSPLKFDYTVIFGNLYKGEAISLQINQKQVFKHFQLNNHDSLLKGNLSLVQDNEGLKINFNGVEMRKARITYDHFLNLKMVVNKKVEKFGVDLRKGNIIILNWTDGALAIQQLQEPFLLDVAGSTRK